VLVRIFPPEHPVTLNAVGMTVGAVILFVASLIAGDDLSLPTLQATWFAMAYMVVIGTGLLFVLWVYVLKQWDASRAAYNFVLTPPVAVLFSYLLLDETIGIELVFGGALVLSGVYVGALRRQTPLVDAPV
jgi:drug/metabolite transporter (DMT)-like permease